MSEDTKPKKKKTNWNIDLVRERVEEDGDCKLISTEYINNIGRLVFRCKCGEFFTTAWASYTHNNVRKCDKCVIEIKKLENRMSHEEIKHFIEVESKSGCKLISENAWGAKDDIEVQCKCGRAFSTTYRKFADTKLRCCPDCTGRVKWDYQKVKDFVEGEEGNGCKLLSKEYINVKEKLTFQCRCGRVFSRRFLNFYTRNQRQCPKCGKREGAIKRMIKYSDIQDFVKNTTTHKLILSEDEYYNSHPELTLECKNGHIFKKNVRNFYHTKQTNCPSCFGSVGEERVASVLEDYSTIFLPEYTFPDLRGVNGGLLRFDFAILNNNEEPIQLIEFDGAFHYENRYANCSYNDTAIHDERKNQYCKDNNIPLLRIPYWEFDNIEEILEGVLENELLLKKEEVYGH